MISEQMAERLNGQVNAEFQAMYNYLQMSAFCSTISLNGCAQWFSMQAEEEKTHALKIYNYLLDQDRKVVLRALNAPEYNFTKIVDVFEQALKHEQHVTSLLNDLAGFSIKEGDHATNIFLQWFITEQIEEEATVRDVVDRFRLVGDNGEGILLLDRELGSRKEEESN